MRRIAAWAVVLCVSASAFAALTPGQKMAAEALVKQFTAPEFDARQKAVDRLVEMGVDVAPVVRDALEKTLDNEVKLRCEMVLKALREKFGAEAVDGKTALPAGAVNYDASRVTLDVKDAPLSEVMSELAEKSGNAPVDAGNFKDRTVTIRVKDVPYFQALNEVCKAAGVVFFAKMEPRNATLLTVPKQDAPEAIAYAGPAVIRVNQIERVRTDRQVVSFRSSPYHIMEPAGTVQPVNIMLDYAVEDRLPVLGGRVQFRKAITPDGKDLLEEQTRETDRIAEEVKKAVGYRGKEVALDPNAFVSIKDTPEGVKGPLTIEGTARLTFAVGRKEIRLDKVFAGGTKTAEADDISIGLTSGARRGVNGTISFIVKYDPQKARNINFDTRAGFGFAVVDARGKNVGRRTGWSQTDDGKEATITINLTDLPADAGDLALVYAWPESVETKEFPFTIKDVPLP